MFGLGIVVGRRLEATRKHFILRLAFSRPMQPSAATSDTSESFYLNKIN